MVTSDLAPPTWAPVPKALACLPLRIVRELFPTKRMFIGWLLICVSRFETETFLIELNLERA